jgi:nucleoside-diphosphate-sugar epimerase
MPADAKVIVVTGAAGFVGGHLVREFSAQGYDVIAADRRSEGLQRLAGLPGVSLQAGDLTDQRYCADLIADARGVIHCAGASRVSSAVNAPIDALQSTIIASGNLFDALRQHNDKWLVVVSTREVETLLANPEGCCALADLYGACKLTVEQLARAFCLDSGIPLVICRLSDVYGSANDHANKLLPVFLERSLAGDPLEIRDTTTKFCFTHIDDVVAEITGAVQELLAGRLTYQIRRIWGERWVTAPELAQLIKEVFVSESKHLVSPLPSKARVSLPHDEEAWHFVEGVSLEEGLKRMSVFQG